MNTYTELIAELVIENRQLKEELSRTTFDLINSKKEVEASKRQIKELWAALKEAGYVSYLIHNGDIVLESLPKN